MTLKRPPGSRTLGERGLGDEVPMAAPADRDQPRQHQRAVEDKEQDRHHERGEPRR
jgi:hypothetical protein